MVETTTTEAVAAMTAEVKRMVNELFEVYYKPKIEKHLDFAVHGLVEQIIEKKIEERFSYAIELLRALNEKKPPNGNG